MDSKSALIQSPFIEEAIQSSILKKRPSKRIKKIANSIYKSKSQLNKASRNHDQFKIINILQERNVPEFLVQFVKKKRIFNMGLIRKISLGKPDENAIPSTSLFLSKQQNELSEILKADKIWKEQRKQYVFTTPFTRKTGDTNQRDYEQNESQRSYSEVAIQSQIYSDHQQYPQVSMFNLMDLDEPLNLMRSRMVQDSDIFMRMF